MTEEEKKAIEEFKDFINYFYSRKPNWNEVTDEEVWNFEYIIKIIEKQQKEIEEKTTIIMAGAEKVKSLEKEIEELRAKLEFKQFGDLDNAEFEKYIDEYKKNDYISKSKIEDKIKELEDDKNSKYFDMYISYRDIEKTIDILKELLESEE